MFYIRQGTYLCIFCTIHTLHLWVLRFFVFLCTDTRLLSSNKTNTFHIPEIHLVYYYCHVGCWCYLLTFLLHVATFGSADMSLLAVNMKKSCCFEMLRCHSIQIRDSQASYLSDTGEYFTKKRNFCQGQRQFLPTKFWGKFWQKH